MKLINLFFCIPLILLASQDDIITFPSQDGITITAKTYIVNSEESSFIILFHQAGWSRGEYQEIAPKLNELGYNCLAIDLRSGGEINGIVNQTYKTAKENGKPTTYIDAYLDMQAALDYVIKTYSPKKIIIWGSSYSAALSLKLAADNNKNVNGVLSFSPGEYFVKLGESKTFITNSVKELNCPVFITSAQNEKSKWEAIYSAIPSINKIFFLPETNGNHGSRALWQKFEDNKDYWITVNKFLKQYFPIK